MNAESVADQEKPSMTALKIRAAVSIPNQTYATHVKATADRTKSYQLRRGTMSKDAKYGDVAIARAEKEMGL
jgi:hypothetical protein